jgi:hypothetical protein
VATRWTARRLSPSCAGDVTAASGRRSPRPLRWRGLGVRQSAV